MKKGTKATMQFECFREHSMLCMHNNRGTMMKPIVMLKRKSTGKFSSSAHLHNGVRGQRSEVNSTAVTECLCILFTNVLSVVYVCVPV